MDIKLHSENNNDVKNGTWCCDIRGNVYILLDDEYYLLIINNKNVPEMDKIDSNCMVTPGENKMCRSIFNRPIQKIEDNNESDDDAKYFEEDKYFECEPTEKSDDDEFEEQKCDIYRRGDDSICILGNSLEKFFLYYTYFFFKIKKKKFF